MNVRTKRFTGALLAGLMGVSVMVGLGAAPAGATEAPPTIENLEEAVLNFDLSDLREHTAEYKLEDGTTVSIGAEPVTTSGSSGGVSALAALNGTWHVWGDNGAFRMEYYVVYKPVSAGSPYTRADSAYGLKVTGRGLGFDNTSLTRVRPNETSSLPSLVEGKATFYYPIVTTTGGVRATVKNGSFSANLW